MRDPRDGVVFYVGKGQQNRWFDHIQEARTRADDPKLNVGRVWEIEASGRLVDAFIFRRGLRSEKIVYEVGAVMIHAYRLLTKSSRNTAIELTNIAEVHFPERGLADVWVAQSKLNAPKAAEITVPCGLFRIPRLWFPEMSDDELREATSGWWSPRTVAKLKKHVTYAFAGARDGAFSQYECRATLQAWRFQPDQIRELLI